MCSAAYPPQRDRASEADAHPRFLAPQYTVFMNYIVSLFISTLIDL